jgi:hypothetical protein
LAWTTTTKAKTKGTSSAFICDKAR